MRLSAALQDCDVGNASAERLTRPAFHRSIFLGAPPRCPSHRGGRTSRPVPMSYSASGGDGCRRITPFALADWPECWQL